MGGDQIGFLINILNIGPARATGESESARPRVLPLCALCVTPLLSTTQASTTQLPEWQLFVESESSR